MQYNLQMSKKANLFVNTSNEKLNKQNYFVILEQKHEILIIKITRNF